MAELLRSRKPLGACTASVGAGQDRQAGFRFMTTLVGCEALSVFPMRRRDPLDLCEAIVGAAQPRRAIRTQVNNPEGSYTGLSPVACHVLFGASREEIMPGERSNNMAMSELVVCCRFIFLCLYLKVLHGGIQHRQMHAASGVLTRLESCALMSPALQAVLYWVQYVAVGSNHEKGKLPAANLSALAETAPEAPC